MQEEKKNEKNGEVKKEKHSRRHGYFIQPPSNNASEQKNTANLQTQNKAEQNNTSRSAHTENGTGVNNPSQKKNDKQNQHNKGADMNVNSPEHNQNSQKKKNHRRNKNRNKPKDNTATPSKETAPKQQSAEQKNAKKSPSPEKNQARVKDAKHSVEHSADDYEEYKLTFDDEPKIMPTTSKSERDTENAPKTEVVGIRFKASGKVYYFDPKGRTFKRGIGAIVDTARGQEFGEVAMPNTFVNTSDIVPPLRPVIRAATTADTEHHKMNKQKEDEAFKVCCEKIAEHKLDMKLIDAQYTFDNSKLLFYFTSSNRVDFRELVKDLASVFRTRIELRQIGIRDEAKIMGGLGMCGRPLCCTLFLSDFDQVSIKMAKEQNLSLNSAKISGICGRLMCCLKYEHEAYEYEIKRTPPVDSLVRTENGDGIVTEISPLQGTVKVRLLASPEVPPKTYKRDDVTMLRKKQNTDKQ